MLPAGRRPQTQAGAPDDQTCLALISLERRFRASTAKLTQKPALLSALTR